MRGSASRNHATVRRAAIACAVLALLTGRVHGYTCNVGFCANSIPCMGTFYLSTAKAGGGADIWLSSSSTSSQSLVSRNSAFRAKMQNDGNFVVYREGAGPLWNAGAAGMGSNPWRLAVQKDGNIVRYSGVPDALGSASCSVCPNNACPCSPTWASGTSNQGTANGPFRLVMQDDGNLVLYNNADQAPWAAGTVQAGYQSDPADISLSKGTCDSCAACAAGKYRGVAQLGGTRYNALSDTCKRCARDAFVFKPGRNITEGCFGCNCGDGSSTCGCAHCPAISPLALIKDAQLGGPAYNTLSATCQKCARDAFAYKFGHKSALNPYLLDPKP